MKTTIDRATLLEVATADDQEPGRSNDGSGGVGPPIMANNPSNTSVEAIEIYNEQCNHKWKGRIDFPVDKGATGTLETVNLCDLFKKTI